MKPCPFCGSNNIKEGRETIGHGSSACTIYCNSCSVSMSADYMNNTKQGVLDKWNRRENAKAT